MNKSHKSLPFIACIAVALCMTGCLKDNEETLLLPTPRTMGNVPSDYSATTNPSIGSPNAIIPNYQFEEEAEEDGLFLYRLDMTGIMNPVTHEWIDLYGTGLSEQNVWLSLDSNPKGLLVKNHSEDGTVSRKFDLVFLVDNSGSMNEESDALARDIINWANNLTNSGIDIQFGCVGYAESGYVNGGIDFTNQTGLSTFLNYGSGTSRTQHFGGANADALEYYAEQYGEADGECGMMALRFANDYYSFRSGANRIYVNFTDEPNQPDHVSGWSVEYLNPANGNWTPQQGTVHTVFSGSTSFTNHTGYEEKPWLMSEYTGGTVLYASSTFSGVSLNTLPVTGAMQHSYSLYFTVPESLKDGHYHSLKVTVYSQDHSVRAERNFSIRFE